MDSWESKLRAFCEGLEMENIDQLMEKSADEFRGIGKLVTFRVTGLKEPETHLFEKCHTVGCDAIAKYWDPMDGKLCTDCVEREIVESGKERKEFISIR